ncbi:HAMP domain-containing histidine kinase [Paenibacillus athensensis]|uniref:histidine kinase n=1 Tax=Paenibacillus athensensis TaxID=1967502 RepID=A0A4Y8Q3B5_9BACL|nr:HAMP domain-containing sensor histidine kinase [Paenibacillus athensensis]MCD1258698.1 HAMP domain-containing histidine kinase [Paenibacillus athensensis]
MSLKLKIALGMTTLLLLLLMTAFSLVYYLFIRLTTGSELALLDEKADTLLLKNLPGHPEYWSSPGDLEELLVPLEMIRYVGPDAAVQHEIYRDEQLRRLAPAYVKHRATKVSYTREGILVLVQVPVYEQGHQIATLEIGRHLRKLSEYAGVLGWVLPLAALGAVVLALLGGYWYTRFSLRPLSRLIATMQRIEASGELRRIELQQTQRRPDELSALGATFNGMIERLEMTFRKQEQFVADVSHELRTPLTVIESYASLLRRWAMDNVQLREEALDAIQSEAAGLKMLTDTLLARIAGEPAAKPQGAVFDLLALAGASAASLQLASGRTIDVQPAAEDGGVAMRMRGDPHKLKQLLVILLDNALKYSELPVVVRLRAESQRLVLQVTDRGIGIPEADLPYLFDRFYRAESGESAAQEGVGLGLAIAADIVAQHGGAISVTSRVGEGTTFTVTLPRYVEPDKG